MKYYRFAGVVLVVLGLAAVVIRGYGTYIEEKVLSDFIRESVFGVIFIVLGILIFTGKLKQDSGKKARNYSVAAVVVSALIALLVFILVKHRLPLLP